MSWREYFGITAEIEAVQPGHTRGLVIFYVVMGLCFGFLAWGVR